MKQSSILLLCASISLLACTKKKSTTVATPAAVNTELQNGLPQNKAINGYFFAGYQQTGANSNYYSVPVYCSFSDPGRNLMADYDHLSGSNVFASGNVSEGNVIFNNSYFLSPQFFGTNVLYTSNSGGTTQTFNTSAHWQTEGNGSFKALNMDISRGFPVVTNNGSSTYSFSVSNGYTLNANTLATNFDSVVVQLSQYQFNSFGIRKSATPASPVIKFSSSDLTLFSNMTGYYAYMTIAAFNYSNKTVNNKSYVFELKNQVDATVYIYP